MPPAGQGMPMGSGGTFPIEGSPLSQPEHTAGGRNPFSPSVLFCCHRWVRAWRLPRAKMSLHTNLALNLAKSSSCNPTLLIWQAGPSCNLLSTCGSPLNKSWCMWSPQIQWEYHSDWEILVSRTSSFPVLVHSQYVGILPLNSTGVGGILQGQVRSVTTRRKRCF